MGADLNNIVKTQPLTDDHVQFLVYQILRGLKVTGPHTSYPSMKFSLNVKSSYTFCGQIRLNILV